MSIYRLPLGQYGYTGHVINLPQDVATFAHTLPRLPSTLDILVVRKDNEQSHRDFHVCRSVLQEALTYLLGTNVQLSQGGTSAATSRRRCQKY